MDSDECHIVNQGACGAFIHGLEDEFLGIKNIYVIIFIASNSLKFA